MSLGVILLLFSVSGIIVVGFTLANDLSTLRFLASFTMPDIQSHGADYKSNLKKEKKSDW